MTSLAGIILLLAATSEMDVALRVACIAGGCFLLAVDRVADYLDKKTASSKTEEVSR